MSLGYFGASFNLLLFMVTNPLVDLHAIFRRSIDRARNSNERRRLILAINLGFIQLILCIALFLFAINLKSNNSGIHLAPILLLASAASLFIFWKGLHKIAILISLLSVNIILFFLSQRVGTQSGINYFFAATAAAALALYGYESWRTGVALAILSMIMFIASQTMTLEFVPVIQMSEENLKVLMLINSCLSFLISMYCVIMILKLNYESEKGLLSNQRIIEQQNDELKKTNAELDRFVYSASHDLRAPLSTISGLINLIELEKKSNDPTYLALIKDRVNAMDKFIKDIIDYARNTRLDTERVEMNLFKLIDEVKESLAYYENADKLNWIMDVPKEINMTTDRERLKVVFNNLITNAIKYADFNKEYPRVEITASNGNQSYFLEIKDNGIGIEQAHQAKVFDMFYRGTTHSKGSGLGLYISREIIQKLGGKISLHSDPGQGSCFRIELPVIGARQIID